jgi:hypothetical protein
VDLAHEEVQVVYMVVVAVKGTLLLVATVEVE